MAKKKHQLELVTLPSKNLRGKSDKVKFPLPPDFNRILSEMIRVCRKHNGIGIAAPQVGLNIRAVIINLEEYGMAPFPLINPEITKYSLKKIPLEEGCLSVPGVRAHVKRAEKVDVKAYTLEGKPVEFKADGILAHVIQHEVDHINGMLFIDRLPDKEREKLMNENNE